MHMRKGTKWSRWQEDRKGQVQLDSTNEQRRQKANKCRNFVNDSSHPDILSSPPFGNYHFTTRDNKEQVSHRSNPELPRLCDSPYKRESVDNILTLCSLSIIKDEKWITIFSKRISITYNHPPTVSHSTPYAQIAPFLGLYAHCPQHEEQPPTGGWPLAIHFHYRQYCFPGVEIVFC